MKVLLANLPWASTEVPSLALGILRQVASRTEGVQADVLHANIDFVDWLGDRVDLTPHDYRFFSADSYFYGCGDWVFSSALYDDPGWRVHEFTDRMTGQVPHSAVSLALKLHAIVPEFVRELAGRIVAAKPDVVGFTTTFQQNVAALATAKQVKRLAPHVITVLGGANCDGTQGAAVHRNFPFVDFVLRGEGERTLPQLLDTVRVGAELAEVPSLCWRDERGESHANPMSRRPLPPAELVSPDYDGYLERLAASRARAWSEPRLVLEGSRGCWWGEKHHCTFCGLNGSFMEFRSKSAESLFAEIIALAERHRTLDIVLVDNILDMNYLTTLLPALANSGHDFRLHGEIKANLRRGQLRTLVDAGLVHVQPGIESLSTRVLKLMDKGATGCQNVRMLRDAESLGMSVEWNYLYGFPSETDGDYETVIAQLPALHHLPPPSSTGRIAIERFSPYFDRPELGFADLTPDPQYEMTYDLPDGELFDLAYVFDAPDQGIEAALAARLAAEAQDWQVAYPSSRLTQWDLGDRILLVNRRAHFTWTDLLLDDPVEIEALRLLDQPHSATTLHRKLGGTHPKVTAARIAGLLDTWRELGLVFTDGERHLQISATANNQELLRAPYGLRRHPDALTEQR